VHAIQLRFPWMCLGVTLPSAARSSSLASHSLKALCSRSTQQQSRCVLRNCFHPCLHFSPSFELKPWALSLARDAVTGGLGHRWKSRKCHCPLRNPG